MACINMYSSGQEQQPQGGGGGGGGAGGMIPNISPRISFSSDFILENPGPSSSPPARPQPGDPDFEFAVGNRPMMAADELIFKGRLLPLRETCSAPRPSAATTTLRDELIRAGADDAWDAPPRHKPGLPKWKGFLGLKKAAGGGHNYGAKSKQQLVNIDNDQACAGGRRKSSSSSSMHHQAILEEEEEED